MKKELTAPEAFKALLNGKFVEADNIIYRINCGCLEYFGGLEWWYSATQIESPYFEAEDPKPERKRLTYNEALKAKKIEIQFPEFLETLHKNQVYSPDELALIDLAERRGYPIYEVTE